MTVSSPSTWRCLPVNYRPIRIRQDPDYLAAGVALEGNDIIRVNEVFEVSETIHGEDGVVYLRLSDGRGWLFDRLPGVGTMCVPVCGAASTSPPGARNAASPQLKITIIDECDDGYTSTTCRAPTDWSSSRCLSAQAWHFSNTYNLYWEAHRLWPTTPEAWPEAWATSPELRWQQHDDGSAAIEAVRAAPRTSSPPTDPPDNSQEEPQNTAHLTAQPGGFASQPVSWDPEMFQQLAEQVVTYLSQGSYNRAVGQHFLSQLSAFPGDGQWMESQMGYLRSLVAADDVQSRQQLKSWLVGPFFGRLREEVMRTRSSNHQDDGGGASSAGAYHGGHWATMAAPEAVPMPEGEGTGVHAADQWYSRDQKFNGFGACRPGGARPGAAPGVQMVAI